MKQRIKFHSNTFGDIQNALAVFVAAISRRNKIDRADEVGNEGSIGSVIELGGSTNLLDAAIVHYHNAVGHGQRLFLVVGDVDYCCSEILLNAFDLKLHCLSQFLVEGTERFIHQDDGRRKNQRAGDGHTLLLST